MNRRDIVFITGASSGIGLALSKLLAKKNKYFLILTARKESMTHLKELFGTNLYVDLVEVDLRYQTQIESVVRSVLNKYKKIDILINNAAIIYRAFVEHVNSEEEKRIMQVNYFAPRELIRLFLPGMKEQNKGKIINISSVGGMMAMPTMSSYNATKFALEGMTESLWYEMKSYNIDITLVQIGFVNSDAFKRVVPTKMSLSEEKGEYQIFYDSMDLFIKNLMYLSSNNPKRIASKIYRRIILKQAPLRVNVTFDAFLFSFFRKIMPRRLYHYILFRLLPHKIKSYYDYLLNFVHNNSD